MDHRQIDIGLFRPFMGQLPKFMEFVFVSKRREFYEQAEAVVRRGLGPGEYVLESAVYNGVFERISYRCCATDTRLHFTRTGRGSRYFDVSGRIPEDLATQIGRLGIPFDKRNITRV